jgi:nitrogen PTS system EIIA component
MVPESAVMNRLVPILDVDDVGVDATAADKSALFSPAGSILARSVKACAPATIAEMLHERERLASTALGHGAAIPQGRVKGLATARAAVIRLREALAFGAPDDKPTSLFVFLVVSERASQDDLDALAEIAEMLCDRTIREKLMQAPDARALYATIADWSPPLCDVIAAAVAATRYAGPR